MNQKPPDSQEETTKSFIWLDGDLIPSGRANIPITTHTLHYGSGAFEGIRCYATDNGPAIFRLSDHIDRLVNSFSCFGVPLPWTKPALEQAVIDTIKANAFDNCYIRPIIFFGPESLLLSPRNLSVHCAIIALGWNKYLGKKAINVALSAVKRIHSESMPVHHKVNGYYVNSIFAFHEATEQGFDEALLLDHEGNIAEGSVANIFFVIDGMLKTPTSSSILPGITRDSILSIAQKLGIPTQEQTLTLSDIDNATEAFFTGTASEITPIQMIGDKKFELEAPGPITQKIQNAYTSITRGTDNNFKSWLTFINQ